MSKTQSLMNPGKTTYCSTDADKLRVLVAIASYGTANDQYLMRLITEYGSMPFKVDVVVLSNIPKQLPHGVEIIVGLPAKDPWSLPFGHRQVFAARLVHYDLFIYSEDDHLITTKNIEAFLETTALLSNDEIAGFFVFEHDDQGESHFCGVHGHYHWDSDSVKRRGGRVFASFTNEHTACYMLTQDQLKRAIQSGGYLVPPHKDKYDMLCSAATDVYTQCGFERLICVSELDRFLVHHLPNKYVNVLGVRREVLNEQIEAIIAIEKNLRPRGQFIPVESKLPDRAWSKLYYEGDRPEILTCVPLAARSVLSVGCGSGALEQSLIGRGCRVVGWPLDSVIGAWAEKKGVEIRYGNTRTVQQQLGGERFDCLLLLDILHLNSEPISFLSSFARLLAPGGVMVISTPNFHLLRIVLRELFRLRHLGLLGGFSASGVQLTSERAIRKWLDASKLRFEKCVKVVPRRSRFLRRWGAKVWGEVFAEELLIVGKSL